MNQAGKKISELLQLDCEAEVNRQTKMLKELVFRRLKRRGAIVAVSGGIDSSVVAALCVKALGRDKVFGLSMPEKETKEESENFGSAIIEHLGIASETEDISDILDAVKCYKKRDDAIREIFPEYGKGYLNKIVLSDLEGKGSIRFFKLVIQSSAGVIQEKRLTAASYLKILSATNYKQRIRKMLEYHYADLFNYAVIGTPNRQEYDQGFFVKGGDGLADIKPIAHLYKSQIYQLAAYLNIPKEIQNRPPTTDTYSMPQSQEEFYFSVPYDIFDICLYGKNHNLSVSSVAAETGYSPEQIESVYQDIENKRKVTSYLHTQPLLLEEVKEVNRSGSALS